MSHGPEESTSPRPELILVRAANFDVTPAIPRAIDAGATVFAGFRILSWDRAGSDGSPAPLPERVELEYFDLPTPPRSIRTVIATIRYALWVLRRFLHLRPRFVQVCDFESALAAAIASCVTRLRFIYDMRDPVADSYMMPRAFRRLLYALDWLVMARASAFVVPAAERLPYLGRWGHQRPVAVVRNTCEDHLERLRLPPTLRRRPAEDTVRIACLGYLVPSRGADWLLDVCDIQAVRLELVVAGVCRSDALRQRLRVASGVQWFGKLPRLEALGLMRDADAVALLYDPRVPVNRMAAPNKFYEALMVGRPVLVSRGMMQAGEVEREGLGFVVRYGDTENLHRAIESLRDPGKRASLGGRCRDYYLSCCRLGEDLERYRELYRSLTTSS